MSRICYSTNPGPRNKIPLRVRKSSPRHFHYFVCIDMLAHRLPLRGTPSECEATGLNNQGRALQSTFHSRPESLDTPRLDRENSQRYSCYWAVPISMTRPCPMRRRSFQTGREILPMPRESSDPDKLWGFRACKKASNHPPASYCRRHILRPRR